MQAAEVDSQDNDSWLGTTHRAGYKFVSFAIARPFFSANANRELFNYSIVNLFLSPTLLHPLDSSSALGLGSFSQGLIFAPA